MAQSDDDNNGKENSKIMIFNVRWQSVMHRLVECRWQSMAGNGPEKLEHASPWELSQPLFFFFFWFCFFFFFNNRF
jgi:hypothetical protein